MHLTWDGFHDLALKAFDRARAEKIPLDGATVYPLTDSAGDTVAAVEIASQLGVRLCQEESIFPILVSLFYDKRADAIFGFGQGKHLIAFSAHSDCEGLDVPKFDFLVPPWEENLNTPEQLVTRTLEKLGIPLEEAINPAQGFCEFLSRAIPFEKTDDPPGPLVEHGLDFPPDTSPEALKIVSGSGIYFCDQHLFPVRFQYICWITISDTPGPFEEAAVGPRIREQVVRLGATFINCSELAYQLCGCLYDSFPNTIEERGVAVLVAIETPCPACPQERQQGLTCMGTCELPPHSERIKADLSRLAI
jgi:hypothetical protein